MFIKTLVILYYIFKSNQNNSNINKYKKIHTSPNMSHLQRTMTTLVIKYTTEEYKHDRYCSDYTEESVTLLKKRYSITTQLAIFNDVFNNKEPITIDNIEDIVISQLMAHAITAAHIPSNTPLYESEIHLGLINQRRYRDRHFEFLKTHTI